MAILNTWAEYFAQQIIENKPNPILLLYKSLAGTYLNMCTYLSAYNSNSMELVPWPYLLTLVVFGFQEMHTSSAPSRVPHQEAQSIPSWRNHTGGAPRSAGRWQTIVSVTPWKLRAATGGQRRYLVQDVIDVGLKGKRWVLPPELIALQNCSRRRRQGSMNGTCTQIALGRLF